MLNSTTMFNLAMRNTVGLFETTALAKRVPLIHRGIRSIFASQIHIKKWVARLTFSDMRSQKVAHVA
jgi:hypothetical protein